MIRRNRFFQSSLLFFITAITISVGNASDYRLTITDKDDHQTRFLVNENLKINFQNDILSMQSGEDNTEFHFDNIKDMRYEPDILVGTRMAREENILNITPEYISFSAPQGESLGYSVYDTQGKIMEQSIFTGELKLLLSRFKTGVYVLKIETVSPVKFIVK